ncbi:MAG TPA: DUF2255 family protein [Trebonia sp.]|jgi:hypothetical protein|nr:DUF2255 family protein [Trebonia sp.]
MTTWTGPDLTAIGDAAELRLSPQLANGNLRSPVTIWVVRAGDGLYIRSYMGNGAAWYRDAQASGRGRISAGGVEADVSLAEAPPAAAADVDAAYRAKYRAYDASVLDPIVAPTAQSATMRLTPR